MPRDKVTYAMGRVGEADALLVVGSSLTVWSGFRFARRAAERGLPIAIVNIGPTRADGLAAVKIEAKCSEVLERCVQTFGDNGGTIPCAESLNAGVPIFDFE